MTLLLTDCAFAIYWLQRGFYTKVVCISRHARGLIPGLFDSTPGRSKLTIDHRKQQVTMEFPTFPYQPSFS